MDIGKTGKTVGYNHEVEQALRRAHCDKRDSIHECQGTITINKDGVHLSCPLCGGDNQCPVQLFDENVQRTFRSTMRAVGVDPERLTMEAVIEGMREIERGINGRRM